MKHIRKLCMSGEGSCSSSGVEINEWWALSWDSGYPYLAQLISRAAQTSGYSFPLPGQASYLALLIARNVTNRSIGITFLPVTSQPVFAFPLCTPNATKYQCSCWTLGCVFGSCLLYMNSGSSSLLGWIQHHHWQCCTACRAPNTQT